MAMFLGCIADDFTGGSDLAGILVKSGLRTLQTIGIPDCDPGEDFDAVVVSLKSRTAPKDESVAESQAVLRWLRSIGCEQIYFKYCSTFDSTDDGNIGPVIDALMDELGSNITVVCPAFPENGRTIYKGNLFVGDLLLAESSMRHHPLTPMTKSNLVQLLAPQAHRDVGLITHETVRQGAEAIRKKLKDLAAQGIGMAVVDAVADADLMSIGAACKGYALVTGASGLGLGIARNFADRTVADAGRASFPAVGGFEAVVAGSSSAASLRQIQHMRANRPAFKIDALSIASGVDVVAGALAWASGHLVEGPVLIYATAEPAEFAKVQTKLGVERAGAMIEAALSQIAVGLVRIGVQRLIIAGGETSGAVVKALGVDALQIGPEIDPGIPWTVAQNHALGQQTVALALKSGNFGSDDFLTKAWGYLPRA